jgi:prefoldin subunit 5
MARIRDNQNDEAAKQRVMNDLNLSLSEHKSKYEKAMTELQECKNALPAKIASLQQQIDILHQRIVDLDQKEIDVGSKVGHQGNTLIQCLIEVRTFAKTIKGGASAYAPLVSILNGMLI